MPSDLFARLPIGLLLADASSTVLAANPAAERVLQREPGSLTGLALSELIGPREDSGRGPASAGRPECYELTRPGPGLRDGATAQRVTVEITELEDSGSATRFIVEVRDATERVATELRLQQAELLLRDALDAAMDAFILVEGAGGTDRCEFHVLDLNARAEEWFGVHRSRARGLRLSQLLPAALDAAIRPTVEGVYLSGEPEDLELDVGSGELVRVVHLQVVATATGLAVMCRDTTEASLQARRRHREERIANAIFERSPIGIQVFDAQGSSERMNDSQRQLLGLGAQVDGSEPFNILRDPLAHVTGEAELFTRAYRGDVIADYEYDVDLGVTTNLWSTRRDQASFARTVFPLQAADGTVSGVVSFLREITDRKRLERNQSRLALAVTQAAEAIVITDPSGAIEYVNPAFERATGYTLDEVLGQNPRLLKSGDQPASFYDAMWRALAAGGAWTGEFVNRRKDGGRLVEAATISPIHDGQGRLLGFVAVKRDVTRERSLEAQLAHDARERASMLTALQRIDIDGTPEEIAATITAELRSLPDLDFASILVFDGDQVVPLALNTRFTVPVIVGRALPASRAAYLRERATLGAWSEHWKARQEDGDYGRAMVASGLATLAYVPLRDGEIVFGVISIGTGRRDDAAVIERLPSLAAFATMAEAMLAPSLRTRLQARQERVTIAAILAERAVAPVFQPIVDLGTGRTLGYEALSRFDAGRPDLVLAQAARVGLGIELEDLCIESALAAASRLPAGLFLSLNASPEYLLSGALERQLAGIGRDVFLELTEHVEVSDYAALLAALEPLGSRVRLAVDDAGAGFASLRHVLELRPDIIKLDRALIEGINADEPRMGLIAGLVSFGRIAGCQILAEGIETEAELVTLQALNVGLGQGYLLGRPVPIGSIAAVHESSGGAAGARLHPTSAATDTHRAA